MKINTLAKMKEYFLTYDVVILKIAKRLCSCLVILHLSVQGFSQEVSRTYEKEITVGDKVAISSNVPTSLNYEFDVHYTHTNNTLKGYSVVGKKGVDRLYIHKDYEIKTWEKDVVKQMVEVKVRSSHLSETHALLDDLAIELKNDVDGIVAVDCNMNLNKFKMKNGRFSGDKCEIILDDGKRYNIEYLELKTTLFIPDHSNLKVESSRNHTLILGDLDGDLELDLEYGEVYGGKVKNLHARLYFCYNVIFDEAESVEAIATNSHLKVDKVKEVQLGEFTKPEESLFTDSKSSWLNGNSSMNIFKFRDVDQLTVFDSANDDFRIGEVDKMDVRNSIYSNYKILKVIESLNFLGKSGDLSIAKVAKHFEAINVQNTLGELNFGIAEESNIFLVIENEAKADVSLPANTQKLESHSDINEYKIGEGKVAGEIKINCDRCRLDFWN